jgi:hypothetical protein
MTAKTSARRRAAFLQALSETGNQTLAAERTKVSRSWVSLHRASDPEFRAAMDAAIAKARDRLSAASGVRGEGRWGRWTFIGGEELVVRGTNGRRAQIARARVQQWTPATERRFLTIVAATCNVRAACKAVGLSVPSAYQHRARWPAFANAWQKAVEDGALALEHMLMEASLRMIDPARYADGDADADGYADHREQAVDPDAPILTVQMDSDAVFQLFMQSQPQRRGFMKSRGGSHRSITREAVNAEILRALKSLRQELMRQQKKLESGLDPLT